MAAQQKQHPTQIQLYKRRKPHVFFTPELKEKFLELLRDDPDMSGSRPLCIAAIGINQNTFYDHMRLDAEFKAAVEEIEAEWIHKNLFQPAVRRARDGVRKPIIGGKFKDEIVAHEQVYSDSLMAMMLRAKMPEFREKDGGAASGAVNVLIVPSAPMTMADWQSQMGELAKGQEGRPK